MEEPAITQAEENKKKRLPHINFRPILFCALGLAFGIFLYIRIHFGGLAASDFLFIGLLLFFAIRPYGLKRILCAALCFFIFAGVGALSIHIYTSQFSKGVSSGEYEITGGVQSFTIENSASTLVLSNLKIDGKRVDGKLSVSVNSDEFRAGDILSFTAEISRSALPKNGNSYSEYLYENGIRYSADYVAAEKTGTSYNVFLRFNSSIYDALHANMPKDEADVAYALLTGNSRGVDDTLMQAIRKGGIAHIFAVSGLHIGILFGAVSLLFSPLLKKKAFLPALAAAIFYSAVCGFTVSSIRAVIMCGVLSLGRAFGRKTDFLDSLSFAAVLVLLFMPAEFLSAGFRLSFGACAGLALFSPTLERAFRKLPRVIGKYLAAAISVQIFIFPVLIESFGYFSVWGMLLNFFLIPLLPVLFLGLLLCTLFALIIPPTAAFFLFLPQGMLSALLYVVSVLDFSFVLTGFSLGAGAAVWLCGSVTLSPRVRLKPLLRGIATGVFCVLFAFCMIYENAVFYGLKIDVYEDGKAAAALLRTSDTAVLVIDGDVSLKKCEDFLSRTYGGQLEGVVVLCSDELDGINVGAFLSAAVVYAREEIATGLNKTDVRFAESFSVGDMAFRYESSEKITLSAEGRVVEFDFENNPALGADLFIGKGSGGLKFFLNHGIIKAI
ncbi:MAG: ComEC family competence protein [Clostridia bacterium]|nr:ComEC family competence protein [Clostridia bacterium]